MRSYASLLIALIAVASVSASPAKSLQDIARRQSSTPSSTGTSGGYFYSWWTDGASPVTYTNGEGGQYSVQWEAGGNLVGGKGWQTGGAKEITYSGTWEPVNNGNAYLTIYGWTRSPLIEYYIVENHGDYDPGSAGESRGSFTASDGGSYSLYESTRTEQPSIDGTATFQQYWAVRDSGRVGGTVNTGEFFDAWEAAGMSLGTHDYMIVATEAYQSAGSSDITVESPP